MRAPALHMQSGARATAGTQADEGNGFPHQLPRRSDVMPRAFRCSRTGLRLLWAKSKCGHPPVFALPSLCPSLSREGAMIGVCRSKPIAPSSLPTRTSPATSPLPSPRQSASVAPIGLPPLSRSCSTAQAPWPVRRSPWPARPSTTPSGSSTLAITSRSSSMTRRSICCSSVPLPRPRRRPAR